MNLADLRSALQDHGYGTDTITEQNRFLNTIYREIHRKRRWPFLEAIDSSQSTVAGTPAYTPPMTNWRNVDAVRISDSNANEFVMIDYKQPQELFDMLHVDQYETATPAYWTMYAQQVWFFPIPDQAYSISYYYIQEPADMAADGDVPLVPIAYHDILVSGAIARMAYRQRDWIGVELLNAKYGQDMQDLEEEYLVRQRQTSSQVKRSGAWDTTINYPLSSTGF